MSMLGFPELDFLGPTAVTFVIVLTRVLGLVITAPNWGLAGISNNVRLVLAIALTAAIAPGVAAIAPPVANPGELPGWIGLLAIEFGIGSAMGLAAALVVAGARQAGEIVAQHAGLAPASLFGIEPDRGLGPIDLNEGGTGGLTPLGHLHGLVAMGVFLTLDGPLVMVRALVHSFASTPPGFGLYSTHPNSSSPLALTHDLFARVTATLAQALQAAAPAGVALLLSGLALAWISRSAAGRPMSGLDWPVRVALGLIVSALSIATLATTLAAAWTGWAVSMGGS